MLPRFWEWLAIGAAVRQGNFPARSPRRRTVEAAIVFERAVRAAGTECAVEVVAASMAAAVVAAMAVVVVVVVPAAEAAAAEAAFAEVVQAPVPHAASMVLVARLVLDMVGSAAFEVVGIAVEGREESVARCCSVERGGRALGKGVV